METLKPYIQWIKEDGFWVRDAWDIQEQKWVGVERLQLFDFQERILSHCLTPDENGNFPYVTIIYSCRKKSGKTAVAASVGAWYMEEANPGAEIYTIASSLEQSEGRIYRDIMFHADKEGLHTTKTQITCDNGTFVKAIPSNYKSVSGSRHALTLFDELWTFISERDKRLWGEMTPIPTVRNSMQFIATYAGFENESHLLWDLYSRNVGADEWQDGAGQRVPGLEDLPCWSNGKVFVYWDHDARMPWQTKDYYDSQRGTLRASDYLRLHLNRWVSSQEAFIPVEWWDAAAKAFEAPATLWQEHPYRTFPVFMAVDAGVVRDSTAVVGVAYDASRGKVGVLFHKTWTPVNESDPVDLGVVENYIIEMYNKFQVASIVYDPTHLYQMMGRLSTLGYPVNDYKQTSDNMTRASQMLYDLLRMKNLEAYPAQDIRDHLQMAIAIVTTRGFRITKDRDTHRQHRIDAAVALAMACYVAVASGGVDVSEPIRIESPFADMSSWSQQTEFEKSLPFALRSR